ERRPGQDLGELFERPKATWEGDEAVGKLGHCRLALVHRAGNPELGQATVRDLGVHQMLRDDADHLTAGGERRVCHLRHQPDPGAAVDGAPSTLGELTAEGLGGGGVLDPGTRARAAEHTDASHPMTVAGYGPGT